MEIVQEFMIQVVGNERFYPGWPGQNGNSIYDRKINSNEIFWGVDSFGTLILRCMNDGLVLLVMKLQNVMEVKESLRRIPRANQKNKIHMDKFWGKFGKVHVWIPQFVYDYKHWMCGVDLDDQNIRYYHPYPCYHRMWIPMFIQLLYTIIFNSYI